MFRLFTTKEFDNEVDEEIVLKIKRGLEDIKHGRITEWQDN